MQQKKSMIFGATLLGGILMFAFYGIATGIASGGFERGAGRFYNMPPQLSAEAGLYREECGACHLAYPPGLMPSQGWRALMSGLSDHFGEDASLDGDTWKRLDGFLQRSSRPAPYPYRRGNSVTGFPLRITEMSYFRHEHHEIPPGFVRGNDKVSSLSQCDACHRGAERGWFDEDDIHIPGIGRWDD